MGRIFGAIVLAPLLAILALLASDAVPPGGPAARQPLAEQTAAAGIAAVRIEGACRPGAFSAAPADQPGHIPYVYPVRPAPDRQALPLDTARAGEAGHACDRRRAEAEAGPSGAPDWRGVVYGDTETACGLEAGARRPRNYAGPCRWGWVEDAHFTLEREAPPLAGIAYDACGDGDCGGPGSLPD
jgi:hypothetical protein